mgnify:CR=1 FL=1
MRAISTEVEPLSEKRYNRLLERRDKFDGRQEKNQIIKEGISSTVEYSQDNNDFEENFNSIFLPNFDL